jgi:hypothetical protein
MPATRCGQSPGDGLRPGRFVQHDAPERGTPGGRAEHTSGPDAVTGHIERSALFVGQRSGHRRDIGELAV